MEMGYYDAAYELARAHLSLGEFYSSHGGQDLSARLKNLTGGAE
jgi:hypothetical protein